MRALRAARNQRSGWALGCWACVLERSCKPVMATNMTHLARYLAGFFLRSLLRAVQPTASRAR